MCISVTIIVCTISIILPLDSASLERLENAFFGTESNLTFLGSVCYNLQDVTATRFVNKSSVCLRDNLMLAIRFQD
jgi:hypothetical protein